MLLELVEKELLCGAAELGRLLLPAAAAGGEGVALEGGRGACEERSSSGTRGRVFGAAQGVEREKLQARAELTFLYLAAEGRGQRAGEQAGCEPRTLAHDASALKVGVAPSKTKTGLIRWKSILQMRRKNPNRWAFFTVSPLSFRIACSATRMHAVSASRRGSTHVERGA